MSTYRQRWLVVLDGRKIEVSSNAWDARDVTVPVSSKGTAEIPVSLNWRVAHEALLRNKVEGVPRSFREFCELLDDLDEIPDDEGAPDELDPTQPAASAD
jgi:hypothetical protein